MNILVQPNRIMLGNRNYVKEAILYNFQNIQITNAYII